jgi:hypothetical protein
MYVATPLVLIQTLMLPVEVSFETTLLIFWVALPNLLTEFHLSSLSFVVSLEL